MDDGSVGRMEAYGVEHVTVLVALVVAGALLVRWARRGDRVRVDRALRVAGWVLLANTVVWTAWGFLPGVWDLQESLPLHYSDFLRVVVSIALITQSRWSVAICYYGGLTLNMQSVVTPDLRYFDAPVLEFVQYWSAHSAAALAPVVLIWGLGHRMTWRVYAIACASTIGWAAVAFAANAATGANYGYLSHAPAGPSLLDLLGPWPWYLLAEAVVIAAVWALMTWPWTRGVPANRPRALGLDEVPERVIPAPPRTGGSALSPVRRARAARSARSGAGPRRR